MSRAPALIGAWAAALAFLPPVWAQTPMSSLAVLQQEVAAQVQAGQDDPAAALQRLDRLAAGQDAGSPEQRVVLLGRGLVLAHAGREGPAKAVLEAIERSADLGSGGAATPDAAQALASADMALVRAVLAHTLGQTTPGVEAAQQALKAYERACPDQPGCDYRSRWQAGYTLSLQQARRGLPSAALESSLAAAELAQQHGDSARQASALALGAMHSHGLGDGAQAQRHFARALRLAQHDGSPALLARMRNYEVMLLHDRGDLDGARRAAEEGLALARKAGLPRAEMMLLANVADIQVKAARPQDAVRAVQRALPLARRLGDRRAELVLMHNGALAQVALGQTEGARRTVDDLLGAYHAAGATAREATVLREFADAFAARGEWGTALALYHRERQLAADIMAANRKAALADLRVRHDREAQQSQLLQLGRESALMSARLANQQATRKVWFAAAAALLLAGVLVALLYRRVREINLRLAHNQTFLRAQSQRDPLTGLINRRGLHEAATQQQVHQVFKGALLLVDIDHFKHVNDGHGHAAGDLVLVEVARRLGEVVREDDIVVRWGGEEFLIYLPVVTPAQAHVLAARVLQVLGSQPMLLAGMPAGRLRVTASVGYACFPLPPAQLPITLDRAINLADMALYTAKNQGRNRAIGIHAARADDDAALRAIEADFDQAWQDARVTLQHTCGPSAAATPPEGGPCA